MPEPLQLHVVLVLQTPLGLLDQRKGDGRTGATAISSLPILDRACR
jgi:hypothetical protein